MIWDLIRNPTPENFLHLALVLPALVVAFTIHELCHGLAARLLGDPTAKRDGRLSLNPVRHIDPVGFLMILAAGFGWAKPVMVNTHNLKNPKLDMAFIAIAGPVSNFLMAFLVIFLLLALPVSGINAIVLQAANTFIGLNIVLGIFNMLPLPPLDGSKVLAALLPDRMYYRLPQVGPYGMLILLVLVVTGTTGLILGPAVQAVVVVMVHAADFIIFW